MPDFNDLTARAQQQPGTIVLAEGDDARVIQAARRALDAGIANPVLVGMQRSIELQAERLNISLDGIPLIDPATSKHTDALAHSLFRLREKKGMTPEKAAEEIQDNLTFSCMMVRDDLADGCVAGAVYATALVVRSALRFVGKHPEHSFVSSFFIMLMTQGFHPVKDVMIFADCALVINPDKQELAEIAIATGESAQQLLNMTPEIAMLSFSTAGSAKHTTVSKVVNATSIARQLRPKWRIIGDVQLDAAVIPEILRAKAPAMATANPANILVFPTLDAGNIGYKMCERFGGADAIGPVLQGLAKPVNDLSRGCKTEDIYNIIAVTSLQARQS